MVITLTNNQAYHIDDQFQETIEQLEAFQLAITECSKYPEYTVRFSDFACSIMTQRADGTFSKNVIQFMFKPRDRELACRINPHYFSGTLGTREYFDKFVRAGFQFRKNFTTLENEIILTLYDTEQLNKCIQLLYDEVIQTNDRSKAYR